MSNSYHGVAVSFEEQPNRYSGLIEIFKNNVGMKLYAGFRATEIGESVGIPQILGATAKAYCLGNSLPLPLMIHTGYCHGAMRSIILLERNLDKIDLMAKAIGLRTRHVLWNDGWKGIQIRHFLEAPDQHISEELPFNERTRHALELFDIQRVTKALDARPMLTAQIVAHALTNWGNLTLLWEPVCAIGFYFLRT